VVAIANREAAPAEWEGVSDGGRDVRLSRR
jgi:hypothetical protein